MGEQKKPEALVDGGAVYVFRSGIPVYVKTADICAMTGKSNQWIGQLASQGILGKRDTLHGAMFDLKETMCAYCAMLEARALPEEDPEITRAEKMKIISEASMKKSKAARAMLEMQELQGKMHRSEDVANMTEDLIYSIRGMMLSLPGRLARDAASLSDPAEVSALVRQEVFYIMEELSRYRYDSKKYEERVRQRMNWESSGPEDGADEDG